MSCREWCLKLPAAEKTLHNFQVFFTAADADSRDNNQTAANAGYSANASIQDLIHNEINNIIAEHTIEEPSQSEPAVPFLMPQQQSQRRTRSNGNHTSLPRINNHHSSTNNNNNRGGGTRKPQEEHQQKLEIQTW